MMNAIGRSQKKVSDDVLLGVYAETKSVWETGRRVGLCGQSVHERITRLGASRGVNVFTDAERERLISEYEDAANAGKLEDLASSMGRTKPFIARQARELGLTNRKRARPYHKGVASNWMKAWHSENEHPRGALGMRHSAESKAKIATASKSRWERMTEDEKATQTLRSMKSRVAKYGSLATKRTGTSWKAGWREIGGIKKYYRSRWEANYARYLEWLKQRGEISDWKHEPETFWFESIKRGVRSYLPDFRVWENSGESNLHEVKGWMDGRSKVTLKRMKKYHPNEKIILIDGKQYSAIEKKMSSLIAGWE